MKGIVLSELLNEAKQEEAPKLKPIEFVKCAEDAIFEDAFAPARDYDRVVLLCKNYYGTEYDAIWAFDSDGTGAFYLGHWNDGVTE
jgi:hypothetical protein